MRMTRHIAHGIFAVLTLAATVTHAATINVSGGGSALQTAINNANAGDILLVAPGTYSPITTDNKAITIESTGGASVTLIDGGGANRCATLGSDSSHTNTVLTGFTLTNGWTADYGGGSFGGTLNNCILTGNTANYGGGSAYGTLNNCTLTGNTAYGGGGSYGGILNNCTLTGNTANYGGGSRHGTLINCTLTGNTATEEGGGSAGGTLNNCIVWGNSLTGSGTSTNYAYSTFFYSCTAPLPSSGAGNISSDPMFMDAANGNFRLQTGSPCIDAGFSCLPVGETDLDGNPRIQGTRVDMGAYEYAQATVIYPHPTLYVDETRPDDSGDGRSWATAKKTIQAAIAYACTGDEIVVTNGVYAPIITLNGIISIRSVNGAEWTIIDGGGTNRCATLGMYRGWDMETHTVLTGFTLQNGNASHANVSIEKDDGGGSYGGTLNNCTLTGNTADRGGGSYNSTLNNCLLTGNTADWEGGGSSYSTLNNCTLTGNTADWEGGGSAGGTLNNCIVWGNRLTGSGASTNYAYSTFFYSCTAPLPSGNYNGGGNIEDDPLFMDAANGDFRLQAGSPCINAGNNAYAVGAFDLAGHPRIIGGTVDMGAYESPMTELTGDWYVDASRPNDTGDGKSWLTAKKSIQAAVNAAAAGDLIVVWPGTYSPITSDNKAITIESTGGAEWTIIDGEGDNRCATLGDWDENHTVLTGFTLTNGSADEGGGSFGGTLNNCTLTGNTADWGGGASWSTLNNCTLTGNTANYGGGASDSTLNNCTLTGNTANYGGGSCWGDLNNCTLTGNTANQNGGGSSYGTLNNCIVWGNTLTGSGTSTNYSSSAFYYSCTTPLPSSGAGNLSSDPMFENAANGDFRLQTGSPCIDAGINLLAVGSVDLDGNPRIQGTRVDMGAYEYAQATVIYPHPTLYVDETRPDDSGDGRSWATAKKSIQAAIECARAGDEVVVTNGVYAPIITINAAITIQSVNGAEWTIIDGGGANRCATLGSNSSHTNTVLTGFTLTNGWTTGRGGGSCYGTLNNCILTGNTASDGGGSYYGTLNNCTLTGNTADWDGGGSYGGTLNNCILTGNTANEGGGSSGGTLNNCILTGNTANEGGGSSGGTLNNCTLTGNTADYSGGGSCYGTLNNCTLTGNTADYGGGSFDGTLNNCTLTGNTATEEGGGSCGSTLNNCIVWGNSLTGSGTSANYDGGTFYYSCTAPLPNDGLGNISSDPMFMDAANGDFRLQTGSPCIDAGFTGLSVGETDLDGNPRIQGTRVDMGAYEYAQAIYPQPTLYVDETRPDDSGDGRSWTTAKKSIQAAIECARAGDEVVVTNGVYAPIITFNLAITIQSVNGAEWTIIDGGGANRCATLDQSISSGPRFQPQTNTVLTGFTLTNGYVLIDGRRTYGGGSYGGTLNNCTLTGNTAGWGGGSFEGTLNNCLLTGNTANDGGGANGGTLNNCTLTGNTAQYGGGSYGGTLNNCILTGNTADTGGGYYNTGHGGGTLNNCILTGNTAQYGGGAYNGRLNNCTLTGNTATDEGGGSYGGTLKNCIVWGNSLTGSGASTNHYESWFSYSCTAPVPSGDDDGGGNIEDDPLFVNAANGNYRLKPNSPCIDKGNNGDVVGTRDLDGNPRIWNDTVDMGAYEFGSPPDYGAALNTPYLDWQTGGTAPWFIQTAVKHEGLHAAQSGVIGGNQNSWIETTVSEAGTFSFWWKVSSEMDNWPNGDWLICTTNGAEAMRIAGEVDWTQQVLHLTGGETTIRWTYAKDRGVDVGADCGWLDDVVWHPTYAVTFDANGGEPASQAITQTHGNAYILPNAIPTRAGYTFDGWFTASTGGTQVTAAITVTQFAAHTLYAQWTLTMGGAVNAPELDWQTGGDAPWFIQTAVTHDGLHAMQSGAIGDSQTSWIETTVTGAGTLSFWWNVSSEDGYDWLICTTNGVEAWAIAGETGWEPQTLNITGAETTIRWTFAKDKIDLDPVGSDCGWLDEVVWTPQAHTMETPVNVPHDWLDQWGGNSGNYEALAKSKGLNGYFYWESYVAGLNPTDTNSKFLITNFVVNAESRVNKLEWSPNYENDPDPKKRRVYTIKGKEDLSDRDWHSPTNSATRFFKVEVKLPE